jgi:hypothetical protein
MMIVPRSNLFSVFAIFNSKINALKRALASQKERKEIKIYHSHLS